jgi:hypothetical protein
LGEQNSWISGSCFFGIGDCLRLLSHYNYEKNYPIRQKKIEDNKKQLTGEEAVAEPQIGITFSCSVKSVNQKAERDEVMNMSGLV